jgi:ABC-2 type transport system ATP-binding protein
MRLHIAAMSMDAVFRALADPVRRQVLDRLQARIGRSLREPLEPQEAAGKPASRAFGPAHRRDGGEALPPGPALAASAMIEVQDLVKQFGAFTAVDRISFGVPEGEIRAFLGPNGAGKTTTIKVLTTMLAATSGRIRVAGHDPVRDPGLVRRAFGIVFQDPSLDDELTAYENLQLHGVLYGLPQPALREGAADLLGFVGLWQRRNDCVKTFSGGMKRRLEIARALLHQPRLLFLDEPTQGLDPQTRSLIWELVRGLAAERKVTVFFTTHAMEEAERVADAITLIDHGRIVAQGSVAAVKEKTGSLTLEEAFIALTGNAIREEEADPAARMRLMRRAWRGR